jgi:hypothetical protein
MIVCFVDVGEGHGDHMMVLAGQEQSLGDLLLEVGVNEAVDLRFGEALPQLPEEATDSGENIIQVLLLPIAALYLSQGSFTPAVVGTTEGEYGMDLVVTEEATLPHQTQTVDEGGGLGAVLSVIAPIAYGCAGPAFVQYKVEIPLCYNLIPPGIRHREYIRIMGGDLCIVDLVPLRHEAAEGRIAVADDQCVLLHSLILLSTGILCMDAYLETGDSCFFLYLGT